MNHSVTEYKKTVAGIKSYEDVARVMKRPIKALPSQKIQDLKNEITKVIDIYLTPFYNLGEIQITIIVQAFIDYDPEMSAEEIALIIRNGVTGKYGKIFGSFTLDLIGDWMQKGKEEMSYAFESMNNERKVELLSLPEDSDSKMNTGWKELKSKLLTKEKRQLRTVYQSIEHWIETSGQKWFIDVQEIKDKNFVAWSKIFMVAQMGMSYSEFEDYMISTILNKINKNQ